jgi:hypothetical protein
MELKTDFDDFITAIRPTDPQNEDLRRGHTALRERLLADESLKKVIVSTFLQGSVRRSTAVRPKAERRADVDVVVPTRLSEKEYSPARAMDVFKPFLERHYPKKWRLQGRSFGIELSQVELDLVVTSAPSESEIGVLQSHAITTDDTLESVRDWKANAFWLPLSARRDASAQRLMEEAKGTPEWKLAPLRIPDRDVNVWEPTHPLEQIRWTRDKSAMCNGHFLSVVRAVKWWRLEKHPEPKHPKGFPLERIVGECCPNGVTSIASGLVLTLEAIVSKYAVYIRTGSKPQLPDYGVPSHDVLKKISATDFAAFYEQAVSAALLARRAHDSTDRVESGRLWQELLGSKFPAPSQSPGKGGFTQPKDVAIPGTGRFA